MNHQDTICAIATANGNGAIAIIRLSGKEAIAICDKIFFSKNKSKNLKNQLANTIHFGILKDKNIIIDEVLVSLFKNPNSYTGENIVEISCHGSKFIQESILKLLLKNGARLANAGEFTLRAFLNGKMDLSQAEAVADLISSTNESNHQIAINQMRGGFSSEILFLRNELVQFISLLELELDFSEEEVEFANREKFKNLLQKIEKIIFDLKNSFHLGNVIKNGVPVAIVGETNVGKSTLLNVLLKENKAIVSDIAGTTRDVIEDTININNIDFRFIDTAGIRQTNDKIESLGIEKTFEKIKLAKIVLLLVDGQENIETIKQKIKEIQTQLTDKQHLILLVNKIDRLENLKKFKNLCKFNEKNILFISAKHKQNIKALQDILTQKISFSKTENETIISNIRHFEALTNAYEAILRILKGLENEISNDFLAMDAREVLHYLGEITGEITTDEILGSIFKNFCIGK